MTEAERLADDLDAEFVTGRISNHNGRKAATELRRLSKIEAEVEALREALKVARTYVDAVVANATGPAKRKNYQKCLQIIDAATDSALAARPGGEG